MNRRAGASAAFGFAALAAAILAVGGALRWTEALVAALAIGALVPIVTSRRLFARTSPLIVMLGIAAVATAIQLIPLPRSVLALLQATGSGLRVDGAALVATSPWETLSLDPPATLRALAGFVILLGIATAALRVTGSERGRFQVIAAVGALCGITAAIVGIHRVLGATVLYGLYEPEHAGPHLLGPLLNLNHLGCLMAIGTVVGLGLAFHRNQPSWMRAGWVAVTAGCAAVTVATVSRGATISLAVGALVTIGALIGQRLLGGGDVPRRQRGQFLTSTLPIGIVGACVIVVVVYASASNVGQALTRTSLDEISAPKTKFAAWKSSIHLIQESPWIGVGRGAFEVSFTRIHPASAQITFSHVENEYLQAVIDWGVPVALLLGLAGVWMAVIAIRRWRDGPLAAAALGGLAVIAVQSNVDFGIELLGLAAPVTALAAAIVHVPLREDERHELRRARLLRIALLGGLALSIAALLSSATTSVDEDHATLREQPSSAALAAALERHPLDYYGYALAAETMVRRGDPRAVQVLNHALQLHPTHPGLHRLAGRLLHRTGHIEQATSEYAAALRGTANPRRLLAEIIALFPVEQAASTIPFDLATSDPVLRFLAEEHRADIATAYLSHVLQLHPDDPRACDLLYASAIRTGALAEITLAAKRCPTMVPDQPSRLALAKILLTAKQYDEVLRILHDVETWTGRIDHKVTGWLTVCDAYLGNAKLDDAKRCVRRLDASGDVPPDQRAELTSRFETIDAALRAAPTPAPAPTAPTPIAPAPTAPTAPAPAPRP